MTEDEHIEMVDVGNRFWREFSELCNRYIDAAPEHLRALAGWLGSARRAARLDRGGGFFFFVLLFVLRCAPTAAGCASFSGWCFAPVASSEGPEHRFQPAGGYGGLEGRRLEAVGRRLEG